MRNPLDHFLPDETLSDEEGTELAQQMAESDFEDLSQHLLDEEVRLELKAEIKRIGAPFRRYLTVSKHEAMTAISELCDVDPTDAPAIRRIQLRIFAFQHAADFALGLLRGYSPPDTDSGLPGQVGNGALKHGEASGADD